MKLLILSDLHAEFEPFGVPTGLVAARWLRNPARFGDTPIVQIAGNHEYY